MSEVEQRLGMRNTLSLLIFSQSLQGHPDLHAVSSCVAPALLSMCLACVVTACKPLDAGQCAKVLLSDETDEQHELLCSFLPSRQPYAEKPCRCH